ncbi:hypothetical protein GLOIN_2v1152501 [Rhizophagus irregularis DAOM 181602=DAOM 197198]|uniref:Uncharacterized protein n=1 Tax=Rhizophagus irregularis (strain DAOM 181602 / DAOM 197198 / MUCL 43194) TaxID=747089 RepID=A0A2P4Q4K9_RHIID|nr:hypothetical protein GLOIN_2v1152501 [Rhizophagus irregularis DAOM 181602=DAOM 197198]POG72528.1 hypothetical protein GLOIN_2v1152501 [Rhizophagus irregularis DAOM 181602=DAOM 197198]GET52444.1 hypothetical protein GLOIN_2v1152501 [Rhizophagus irregularis DAOM 181602=DAOM 197198]|eukprot:XP_025179394.1 hypothetical protein GLOIN_2v1152501 [Rhizophagus irregularis DAOM 181602=DAOM 197198]
MKMNGEGENEWEKRKGTVKTKGTFRRYTSKYLFFILIFFNETYINVLFFLYFLGLAAHWTNRNSIFRRYTLKYFFYLIFFNETYINISFFYFLGSTVFERMEFNISKVYTGFYFGTGHLIHE